MRYATGALGLTAATLALAGCGHGTARSPLHSEQVPLPPGAEIVTQARQCDRGVNAFCALELVVVDPSLRSSGDLVTLENRALRQAGWSDVTGDAGNERGSNSPGQKLHLNYGTALADLVGQGAGWFKRAPGIGLALSRQFLRHIPAIALALQTGPA